MTLRRLMQKIVQGVFVAVNPANLIAAWTFDASSISLRKDRPICVTARFYAEGVKWSRATKTADALASLAFSRRQRDISAPDAAPLNKLINLLKKEAQSGTFFNRRTNRMKERAVTNATDKLNIMNIRDCIIILIPTDTKLIIINLTLTIR